MRVLIALAVALAAAWPCRAGEALTIEVDVGQKRQTVAGFGGTVGWIYPARGKLEEVADLLFTDLGASILRLAALSRNGDASDELSPEPRNDNGDASRIDWKGFEFEPCEREQALLARAAVRRGVRTVVAASWSPPGWMKSSGSRKWGGELRAGMEDELGELWSAYLLWMKREGGVAVSALSVQNEPEVPRPYPTGEFSPEGLDRAARALLRRARGEKLEPRLLYPEVSQLGRLERYLQAASRETLEATGAVSVHAYDLSVDYFEVERYRPVWRRAREAVARTGKPLWMTEFSNYSGAFSGRRAGSWEEALAWARHVHLALVEGECAAVLFWGLYFDKKGEALVYAEKSGAERYEVTPKFHTSKNYFRFIRPGAVRVACSPSEGALECSAFWHAERRELAVVAINPGGAERQAALSVKGLAAPGRVELHRSSAGEKCLKLDPERERCGDAALRFPGESVTTLVFGYGEGK